MTEGFQGAIIIDDPMKPEDAFSKPALDHSNRKLITTVKSRRANPKTPIIFIMQRVAENDSTGFIEQGHLDGKWTKITVPAIMTEAVYNSLSPRYQALVDRTDSHEGRFSYWPYKEPLEALLKMEKGEGIGVDGQRMSRYVFASQYAQTPKALGGNLIKGEWFMRHKVTPKLKWRKFYADTAQKTKEHNDWSVFAEAGETIDGRAYIVSLMRGRWESPELKRRAIAMWSMAKDRDTDHFGQLREMDVEDKSSGTDLIQTLRLPPPDGANIPIRAVQRNVDKLVRVNDAQPYIEVQGIGVPEDAPWLHDFYFGV